MVLREFVISVHWIARGKFYPSYQTSTRLFMQNVWGNGNLREVVFEDAMKGRTRLPYKRPLKDMLPATVKDLTWIIQGYPSLESEEEDFLLDKPKDRQVAVDIRRLVNLDVGLEGLVLSGLVGHIYAFSICNTIARMKSLRVLDMPHAFLMGDAVKMIIDELPLLKVLSVGSIQPSQDLRQTSWSLKELVLFNYYRYDSHSIGLLPVSSLTELFVWISGLTVKAIVTKGVITIDILVEATCMEWRLYEESADMFHRCIVQMTHLSDVLLSMASGKGKVLLDVKYSGIKHMTLEALDELIPPLVNYPGVGYKTFTLNSSSLQILLDEGYLVSPQDVLRYFTMPQVLSYKIFPRSGCLVQQLQVMKEVFVGVGCVHVWAKLDEVDESVARDALSGFLVSFFEDED